MKKKTLAMVLSAAMVAAVITGCSSGTKETESAATEAVTEAAAEAESETEEATEAESETEAVTEAESETEEATEAESETEEVTEAESETEEATEAESETEAVTEAESETEEATEAESETEEVTEAESETEEATEAETEEVTEAAAEAESETEEVTEAESETEEATEAESETEEATEAESETEEVTEAESETEEATEVESETEEETEAESETEEATEAESETEEVTEAESETEETTEVESETEEETEAESEAADAELVEGSYTIGISQFAEHGSLDNCREGFLAGLEAEGFVEGENLTIEYDNAQSDTGTAATIADSYVSDGVDLICAIATPSAMSAYNSAMNTDIPVVYTAVSDPVAAGLANEDGTPVGNITGTADALPVEEQLQMIREILPDAEKIGILYTTSETNSESTLKMYEDLASDYGFEIVSTGINTIADVDMAAAEMVGEVDCITNLTDNTVVSALQTVLSYANEANIPVFGSEIEQVRNGCLASMGIDYIQLGEQTGEMAAAILKGEATASEMNFETCEGANLYVNTEVADNLGIEISDDYIADATEVFDTITVE